MATAPTDEDAGRHILDVFKGKGSRSGDVLRANILWMAFANPPWRGSDFQVGAAYAADRGWIEEMPSGGVKLTEGGFAEM